MTAPTLKQKPSGIWFVEFVGDGGERRRVSTGVKTPAQRQPPQEARLKMRDIVLGIDPASQPTQKALNGAGHKTGLTMGQLFTRCEKTVWAPSEAKSQATIKSTIKILVGLIGDELAADMTYTKLEELVGKLRERGYAPATIKRKMDMVSKALRMATIWTDERGRPLLASKPTMPSIRIANLKDRVIHGAEDARLLGVPDEEAAIFAAVEARRLREPSRQWGRLADLLRFLMDTGGRLGESLRVGPADLKFQPRLAPDGSVVQVPTVVFPRYQTKSDKPRAIPLTPAAMEGINRQRPNAALIQVKGDDGVSTKEKLAFFPMRQAMVWYMFDTIREDVKAIGIDISDVTLHTFRHTCLTRLARGGMDLLRLQQWAGHSDPKITAERYAHIIPSDLVSGLAILAPSIPAPTTIRAPISAYPESVLTQ